MLRRLWRSPRFLACAIALLIALIVAVFLLHYTSPAYVRRVILEEAADQVHGSVEVGRARLQVFRGLKLSDVRLTREGETEPDIAAERVRCDWGAASLFHGEIEPRRLVFIRPRIRLVSDANRVYNVEKLFKIFHASPKTDNEPVAAGAYDRFFSEGIFIESGHTTWTDARIFDDRRGRVFTGVDASMKRSSESLNRWELAGLVRGKPFDGTRVEGWMDLTPKRERVSLQVLAKELYITPDLLAYLPTRGREALSRFALAGKTTITTHINYWRGTPVEVAFDVQLHNTEARLRTTSVRVRAADAVLRFDGAGFTCKRMAGFLWDGALLGGAASQPEGGGTAWVTLENADLARMAKELKLTDRQLRGLLSGSAKLRWGQEKDSPWSAEGTLEVANAHLAKIPSLALVFKVLNFRFPSGEVFDRGECKFSIWNNRIYVEDLTISSRSVELTATGEIEFNGTCDLVVLVASSDREPGWLITRPIRAILRNVEKQISPPVSITGPPGNRTVKVLTMEPITRPFRNLRDLLPFVGTEKKPEDERRWFKRKDGEKP